jgi:hypothetical protein
MPMAETTETIGWGGVDDRPGRLPRVRLRLTRRRRIALVVVAALVAGGIVGWPSFRSWRADAAAAEVQHIWARAQGFDAARVVMLAGVQSTIGPLDRAAFAEAVADLDVEEAADLDRLEHSARGMRTWTSDVTAARKSVATALTAQAAGLRRQARDRAEITIDLPLTTSLDDQAVTAGNTATDRVDGLRNRHHLKPFAATTERLHAATTILATLRRPTDQPLHLQLVTTGSDGMTVTDLDTGRAVARRTIDITNAQDWAPRRLFGQAVVGSVDQGTLIVPFDPRKKERLAADRYVESSTGSPMWTSLVGDPHALSPVDESGQPPDDNVVELPSDLASTGIGNGSALVVTNQASGDFTPVNPPPSYALYWPASGRRTKLATSGCPMQEAALGGSVIVVPTGKSCDFATELQLFSLSGRLIRTTAIPGGDTVSATPACSPDGKHVAVLTAPPSAAADEQVRGNTRLLDVRTGTWTTIGGSGNWMPLEWSGDGTTLLLQLADDSNLSGRQFSPLAYLRLGDTALHSMRVAADLANYLV